jgi:tricorn protease-like protein
MPHSGPFRALVSFTLLACLLFALGTSLSPQAEDGADAQVTSTGRLYLPVVMRSYYHHLLTRVSVASDGVQGNGSSSQSSISANGRYVAFASMASNLVSGDTNNAMDIFVHDRQTGETTRVSVATGGAQANGGSMFPSISGDGRYVAFSSYASNLVSGDTNNAMDIFVHDRQAGQTTRVSVSSGGVQANNESWRSSISSDGRYVAFQSSASNLVSGDTNNQQDIFVRDRQTGETTRVSVATDGTPANWDCYNPSISADGRYVAFESVANNLVPDGSGILYNNIYVRDRQSGQTSRVSVSVSGGQAIGSSNNAFISADGRFVVFESWATNLVTDDTNDANDIFVRDRQMGQTTRVSVSSTGAQANGYSWTPVISADGRYVAFRSEATNLVSGDTNDRQDIFVRDRQTGQTTRVSLAVNGAQANRDSLNPAISGSGRYVAFNTEATNLVSGDTNGVQDVFVHDRGR